MPAIHDTLAGPDLMPLGGLRTMTPDEEASLRQRIRDAQKMHAYFESKGSSYGRGDDPRWCFERASFARWQVECLQEQLTAAGLRPEPDRAGWS